MTGRSDRGLNLSPGIIYIYIYLFIFLAVPCHYIRLFYASIAEPNYLVLKGKTGIPSNCFVSNFCKTALVVQKEFSKLFDRLKSKTNWIFLSYNSESIVSKEKMLDIMKNYGTASVIERDYKRFKSFEYNFSSLLSSSIAEKKKNFERYYKVKCKKQQ